MIRVGILGATGYMGGEALRVLLDHPDVELAWLASRAGTRVDEAHPNHFGLGLELIRPGEEPALSVLDSIGKGGAHGGIENMSLLFGLGRTTGLARRGRHP
jgi:N-acetyl-gamma-glutamylphosphate reductase